MTEKTQPSGTIPEHYRKCCGVVEPRELLKYMPFFLGNACKYLLRAPYKDSEEKDLLKALDYLTWSRENGKWGVCVSKGETLDPEGCRSVGLLYPLFKNKYINVLFSRINTTGCTAYDDTIRLVKSRLKELGHDVE